MVTHFAVLWRSVYYLNGNHLMAHSVVILDNCAIHHVSDAVQMIEEVGAIVHFLPPYSPNFMPIVVAFSKVKALLKTNEQQMEDTETALLAAFSMITPQDCKGWISES